MTDVKQLNDPEYRWYHKEEMSKIMPFRSERERFGIVVIDYDKLRLEYLSTIKESKVHHLNWDRFKQLVSTVPQNLDKSLKKTKLQPKDMYHFERRDACKCFLCETVSRYTQFHHIIPNGGITDENIVTLCEPCHEMVHLALYSSGKWNRMR